MSRKAWTLPLISKEFENTLGKVAVALNTRRHSIRVLNEGVLATVEICVLSGWRFLNHFDIVSETP